MENVRGKSGERDPNDVAGCPVAPSFRKRESSRLRLPQDVSKGTGASFVLVARPSLAQVTARALWSCLGQHLHGRTTRATLTLSRCSSCGGDSREAEHFHQVLGTPASATHHRVVSALIEARAANPADGSRRATCSLNGRARSGATVFDPNNTI